MDKKRVDEFLLVNQKFLPSERIMYLKEKLYELEEDKFSLLYTIDFKDPIVILLISIFAGFLGIDRFMLEDTGMGILKLLTGGCCGVLTIIDWVIISNKTKEYNFNKIMLLI